jgi:transposase-like protein
VKGRERFLYRAVDSSGQTIDFLLTGKRDTAAAKRFFQRGLANPGNGMPRVINVDKNRAYPAAVDALKKDGTIQRRCRLRQCKYLNNVVEQDHRNVKRRTWLAKGYRSVATEWRTLRGIEAMDMIRKGRARRVAKGNVKRNSICKYGLFWQGKVQTWQRYLQKPWLECVVAAPIVSCD